MNMVRGFVSAFAAVALLAGTLEAQGLRTGGALPVDDGRFRPILIETEGAGPAQRVNAFTLNPDIREDWAMRGHFASDWVMQAIGEGFAAHQDAQADAMFRNAAWEEFSFAFDVAGEFLTQAENLGQLSLTNINNAMTELGLFMTVWRVTLDLSAGDNRAAGLTAFRGMLNYARGKLGWPELNLFNPAIFIINHAVTSFGEQAWLARTDAWRIAYTSYYTEYDRAAEAAQWGAQASHLSPTDHERLEAMRHRVEGGRSRNEWALFLYHAQRHARTPERFMAMIETEIRNYVTRFWDSPQFDLYSRDIAGGSGTWGFARGASLTQAIRDKLEEEHTASLMGMFTREILPRITHRNWIEATTAEVARLNADLRPALNAPLEISLSALDIDSPTQFEIPLGGGRAWRGTLEPGQDRVIRATKYAWLTNGAPNRIVLLRPEGPEEQRIFFEQTDRAEVLFGRPQARVISQFRVSEGAGRCDIVHEGPMAPAPYSDSMPARDDWVMNFSVAAPGSVLLGRYVQDDGWQQVSTGRLEGERLVMAEPRFDDILSLSACSGGFLSGQHLAQSDCTLSRQRSDIDNGLIRRTTCHGPAQLTLTGVHLLTGEEAQFYDFSGPAGRQMRDAILQSLNRIQSIDPDPSGGVR
ncbi:MAG: hypothetical protein JJU15_00985 [Pararhodobacter sp.]|nr:hypothetical protein [Pararhodobacter sp.]